MSIKSKSNIYIQGMVLVIAGIITKIIGFLYRIPMSNMLGDEGNGIYSVAFGIYNFILIISSYSLPLAVSKLVSARLTNKEYKNSYRLFRQTLLFAFTAGVFAFLVLYLGAGLFEKLYCKAGLAKPLRVLAPTAFIVAILGVFRGYFQGRKNMVPTAISQIVEQLINAVVSVLAVFFFMYIYSKSSGAYAYGAAAGTLGTFAGALSALIIMLAIYLFAKADILKENNEDVTIREKSVHIQKVLFLTIIPVILSQTIYQIGYTLDDLIFANIMKWRGFESVYVTKLQGVFNTQYNQLINLPVAISTAVAAVIVPSIIRFVVQNRPTEMKEKINTVIKINMAIAIPSAIGLMVMAKTIILLLFPKLVTYHNLASQLLITGSSAVIFYSLSTITTAILQGNNYMKLPVVHSAFSLFIHIVLVTGLLSFTDLGVYSLIIGNILFPLLICILNCIQISKKLGFRWDFRHTFIFPLISSVIMGIVAYASYFIIFRFSGINWISVLFAVTVAGSIYFLLILQLECFTNKELKTFPFGEKIAKLIYIKKT